MSGPAEAFTAAFTKLSLADCFNPWDVLCILFVLSASNWSGNPLNVAHYNKPRIIRWPISTEMTFFDNHPYLCSLWSIPCLSKPVDGNFPIFPIHVEQLGICEMVIRLMFILSGPPKASCFIFCISNCLVRVV